MPVSKKRHSGNAINHRDPTSRNAIKARLLQKVEEKWGNPRRAIAEGVATRSLYLWVSPNKKTLPSADDLANICERGSISPTWLLLGVGPEAIGETWPRAEFESELRSVVTAHLLKRGLDRITIRGLTGDRILASTLEVLEREVDVWGRFAQNFITVLRLLPLSKEARDALDIEIKDLHQLQLDLLHAAEQQAPTLAAFERRALGLEGAAEVKGKPLSRSRKRNRR